MCEKEKKEKIREHSGVVYILYRESGEAWGIGYIFHTVILILLLLDR